jgi:hypothetical protein
MTVPIKCECPKCHADRTMLDTSFGIAGFAHAPEQEGPPALNLNSAVPVKLILCPRCHYLEMYHDIGLGKLC